MRRLWLFVLKVAIILAGPILSTSALAQLQPLPIFQSKGSFSVSLPVGTATVTSNKIDATAFASITAEIISSCPPANFQILTMQIKGSNDRTMATSSYPVLQSPNANYVRTMGSQTILVEVQPLMGFITASLSTDNILCSLKMNASMNPISSVSTVQGAFTPGSSVYSPSPVITGGTSMWPYPTVQDPVVVAASMTPEGALFTAPIGAHNTYTREILVLKPAPANPTYCTTAIIPHVAPNKARYRWIWMQNNGPDPIRCIAGVSTTSPVACINDGFIIPADGGNMSIETQRTISCVVVGVADQVTGAATNVIFGWEKSYSQQEGYTFP